MMSDLLTDYEVTELLPQCPPFIMIDKLTGYERSGAVTVFRVRADNLFCRDGILEEAGLIENIAQTCAAKTGYRELTDPERDGVVKIGFIGMIKRMEMYRNPRVGEQLTTTIQMLEEVFHTMLVDAQVEIGDEVIATCEMKIYLTAESPEA
jgi:predicted hotdog family 3-hydroxylacyl-ACP dehydratase